MNIKVDMQKCLFISNYELFNFPLKKEMEIKYNENEVITLHYFIQRKFVVKKLINKAAFLRTTFSYLF